MAVSYSGKVRVFCGEKVQVFYGGNLPVSYGGKLQLNYCELPAAGKDKFQVVKRRVSRGGKTRKRST